MKTECLFPVAVGSNFPVALWRLPDEGRIQAVVELSETVAATRISLEDPEPGFAFGPFINPEGNRTLFVRGDLYFETLSGSVAENPRLERDSGRQEKKRKFLQAVESWTDSAGRKPPLWHNRSSQPTTQSEREHYCRLVAKGVQSIQQKTFEKLVLSRTKNVLLPADFHVVRTFERLCEAHPRAFVCLLSIPGTGTWMGATPEILVRVNRDNQLQTVALGGTQLATPEAQRHPVWEKKEIGEQAFISQYVTECFRKIGIDTFTREGPRTITAGNLLHLETRFSIDLNTIRSPRAGSRMLELLHPTPAVCGIPKEEAAAFLTENEGYERLFYAGYLGPVGINRESHLYVNLRCMQLYQRQAILYVGAGITRDSDPEKEWSETEAKCHTLLPLIAS